MEPLRIRFDHGAGDCAQFVALLALYRRRGFDVAVNYEANKSAIWDLAGIPSCSSDECRYHPWLYNAGFNEPVVGDDSSGSKVASNLNQLPLPPVGDPQLLWEELCADISLSVDAILPQAILCEAGCFIRDLPRPITLFHPMGTNWAELKNLPRETIEEVYTGLLDDGGSVVVLDWDNRVPLLRHARFRHTLRDWGHLSLQQLGALMQVCDLLIGVDSGPFHFSRFTKIPALGVFHHFYPSCVALPHPLHAHMTRSAESYQPINQSRRRRWNIVEYDGVFPSATDIVRHARRFLAGSRYLPAGSLACDVMMQQWVRDWCRTRSSLSWHADRDLSMDRLLCEVRRRFASPVIVETGCIRAKEDWSAGYSSYLFGFLTDIVGGRFYSVDNDESHVRFAQREVSSGMVVVSESVEWLSNFRDTVHVLYLDSLDCEVIEHAEHALRELHAVESRLSTDALIVIDDTVWEGGGWRGKGALVVPYLLSTGWHLMASGYQCLLGRG